MAEVAHTAWYRQGTTSVTSGSTTVTGIGTKWLTAGINPGAAFRLDAVNAPTCEIANVVSDTEIQLVMPYSGSSASKQTYSIDRNHQSTLAADLAARLAKAMGNWEAHYDLDMERITGKSAFEIAVENGYTGSVAQWLESLKAGEELTALQAVVEPLLMNNAGAHNSQFRGKNLGLLTAEQTATIQAATFNDIWLGDYWTFSNVAYTYKDVNGATQSATWSGTMRVAGCDYAWGNNSGVSKHHVAVIPDGNFFNANMNAENTTEGGYAGSLMHTVHMKRALAIFEACFGADHIVPYYASYSNAVNSSHVVTGVVGDENAKVELMSEAQVYGYQCYKSGNSATIGLDRMSRMFPLFSVRPDLSGWRQGTFWLRDVATLANCFCCCLNGGPDRRGAVCEINAVGVPSIGVRPYALVC